MLLYETTLPGVITCNMTNCTDINGLRAEDLTRGTAVCRSQIQPIVMFLREYVPGFEHCYALSSASLLGVAGNRHFHGRYTLTREDILEKRVFEDWIVRDACFNFDVHNIDGAGLDKAACKNIFPKHNSYTIPYRCLRRKMWKDCCWPGGTFPVRTWRIPITAPCPYASRWGRPPASPQRSPAGPTYPFRRRLWAKFSGFCGAARRNRPELKRAARFGYPGVPLRENRQWHADLRKNKTGALELCGGDS